MARPRATRLPSDEVATVPPLDGGPAAQALRAQSPQVASGWIYPMLPRKVGARRASVRCSNA